jgi:hypothetical protein
MGYRTGDGLVRWVDSQWVTVPLYVRLGRAMGTGYVTVKKGLSIRPARQQTPGAVDPSTAIVRHTHWGLRGSIKGGPLK